MTNWFDRPQKRVAIVDPDRGIDLIPSEMDLSWDFDTAEISSFEHRFNTYIQGITRCRAEVIYPPAHKLPMIGAKRVIVIDDEDPISVTVQDIELHPDINNLSMIVTLSGPRHVLWKWTSEEARAGYERSRSERWRAQKALEELLHTDDEHDEYCDWDCDWGDE